MNILYVEKDAKLRDIYVMKLEADFKAQVTEVSNEAEAVVTLETDTDYQLILIDLGMIKKSGSPLYNMILKESLDIPMVLITDQDIRDYKGFDSFREDHDGNRLLPKPISNKSMKVVVHDALKSSVKNLKDEQELTDVYTPVKINNFTRFNKLPVEVFIKLSEDKFLKLINANDIYSSEVVQKYVDKGVSFLFVRENEYPVLADTGIKTLLQLYDRKVAGDKVQDIHLMAIEDIHKSLQEVGLDEEVVELTKKTVESSVVLIKRSRNIAKLLNNMKKHGDYLYEHSQKISYIAIAIAKSTEWNSDNTCFKLSLAAMMHDMTIPNSEIAIIQTKDDERLELLNPDEKKIFLDHPLDAAALVRENKMLPSDIDFIVAQHHERPGGDGFPRGLSKLRISPLACIFILAHEFYNRMEGSELKYNHANIQKVVDEMRINEYDKGNFKKPFQGLLGAFLAIKS